MKCMEIGPRLGGNLTPFMCSLEFGHPGAHQAILDGDLLDSWPRDVRRRADDE